MDHSSQYIFIKISVFAKRSPRNFATIPDQFLWHIWYISVCYVLLVTPRLFFEFTWSEKVFLLNVFFHFSYMSQKVIAFQPPSYHEKKHFTRNIQSRLFHRNLRWFCMINIWSYCRQITSFLVTLNVETHFWWIGQTLNTPLCAMSFLAFLSF